jgi:PAS domain S-box-containing protein
VVNVYVDAVLFGMWTAGLGFPTWIAYAALFSTALNATTLRGIQGSFCALACFAVGAALWVAGGHYNYWPMTSSLVSTLCFFGSCVYSCSVGYVLHDRSRRLSRARDQLRESEHRYRLIAENAADLIGLVDPDGRWLYASPSYDRILHGEDVHAGVDAFRRVHPDDADRARAAVLRAAAAGKPHELPLRLVDREGRVRQYRMRVSAIEGGGWPGARLLVSQDITDLRESEERLLREYTGGRTK